MRANQTYFDPRYYTMAGYLVDEFPSHLAAFQEKILVSSQRAQDLVTNLLDWARTQAGR